MVGIHTREACTVKIPGALPGVKHSSSIKPPRTEAVWCVLAPICAKTRNTLAISTSTIWSPSSIHHPPRHTTYKSNATSSPLSPFQTPTQKPYQSVNAYSHSSPGKLGCEVLIHAFPLWIVLMSTYEVKWQEGIRNLHIQAVLWQVAWSGASVLPLGRTPVFNASSPLCVCFFFLTMH